MTAPLDPAPLDSPELSGDTLVEERTDAAYEDGDHERFAHYVRKEIEPVSASCSTCDNVNACCSVKPLL